MIDHIGSLCSGFGGLDRALSAFLGLPFGWHAEIEKLTDKHGKVTDNPVCELLAARYPGVPNHGDITAIDWASLARPRAIAAGFPCQGVSSAGLQLGDADPRWLWPAVRAGIDALRPEWVAIENVANLVSIQGGRLWRGILADLAELGYAVAWGIFGACLPDVAGCHHRHRVFALARQSAQPVAKRWSGKACGAPPRRAPLLATPTARDGEGRGEGSADYWDERGQQRVNGLPLGAQVALLPTPVTTDAKDARNATSGRREGSRHHSGTTLTDVMHMLPTPRSADASGGRDGLCVRPNGTTLPTELSLLPTPAARSGDDSGRGLPSAELAQQRMDEGRRHLDDALALLPTPRATVRSIGGPGQRGSSGDLAMPSAVQPQNFGRYAWAVDRWTRVHGPAPRPTEPGPRGGVRMAAAFPEWMMGLAPGFVTDVLPRRAALHAIGNGVFPLQAFRAFGHLAPLLAA